MPDVLTPPAPIATASSGGWLSYERTVAPADYNRWLVPPAALAVHLSIGQAYAFSVFNKPLQSIDLGGGAHWKDTQTFYIFSTAIVFLGLSAAVFGRWLERAGPRKAMVASAACFSCGFFVSAAGAQLHQLWLLYLGYGVLGGIGLGLGYISPVSTLIKWFADRPGLATGMAIMGFGGGAMIGSPLAVLLMNKFKDGNDPGVAPTMLVMGAVYGCFILFGAFLVRVPPKGWLPAGYKAPEKSSGMISAKSLDAPVAIRTPQFWLLWVVLCTNVTAGIGILEKASPMVQDMFAGRLGDKAAAAATAGGFVGVLSLFNMVGRFFWSSTSDKIGRKPTYMIFFALGVAGYLFLPNTGHGRLDSLPLFVLTAGVLLSMYGGGFATIPAYLRDMFGPANVSAIHGRLLTSWSVAGVLGPMLVSYIYSYQVEHGRPTTEAYGTVLYVMAGLLAVGFVANLLVRPVDEKYFEGVDAKPVAPGAAH